jgi:putative NIF3 family GTP cyclohydrolase 1 type 2
VKTVAVCAGSGSSVLAGVAADLYVTGEMSHHDVLNATHRGSSVILCEHSNTERGFLIVLRQKLKVLFDGLIDVHISESDRDPLNVV